MQWSSWSKHVFEHDDSHAISCAISRQEKGGLHKCIARFITYSSPGRADTWFPSLPRKECTSVRYVITKFSRMDGLPNFITHGAPLARFTRRSSAKSMSGNNLFGKVFYGHDEMRVWESPNEYLKSLKHICSHVGFWTTEFCHILEDLPKVLQSYGT